MGLSYKGYNDKVFVIFGGEVREAFVVGVNSNARGVVVGKRVRIPGKSIETGQPTLPTVTDILKGIIFTDEEVANKTFFTLRLKGEI